MYDVCATSHHRLILSDVTPLCRTQSINICNNIYIYIYIEREREIQAIYISYVI